MSEPLDLEQACEVMHDAYEQAAKGAGWETQERSRVPWADVPEANKATMRAAVQALIEWLGVDRLRDEITDRANVEADLRAQLADPHTG